MSQDNPITKAGHDAVQAELDHLIKEVREELKVTIGEARELGDLKENAEYHAAKEKQQGKQEGPYLFRMPVLSQLLLLFLHF